MTPKEKAEELVSKFESQGVLIPWTAYLQQHSVAKQYALIAVDEILRIEYWAFMEMGGKQEEDYWQQVKNEIEKL